MTKSKSWTRLAYQACYQYMRRGIDCELIVKTGVTPPEIIKAADYSYQAKDHFVTGWTNGMRFEKFYEGVQSCKYSTWSIPF